MLQELNMAKMKLSNLKDKLALLLEMKEKNASLDELKEVILQTSQPRNISNKDLNILFTRLDDVDVFDTRTKHLFPRIGLITIQDLLRFIKKNGLVKLLNVPGLGRRSLKLIQKQLEEMGLLDERGESPYFQY